MCKKSKLFAPGNKTKAILHSLAWVAFISFFSFGFLLLECAQPQKDTRAESLREVFTNEFSTVGTFFVMFGILFFLIYDYVINRESAVKDQYGRLHYPASVFYWGLAAAGMALLIFALTINLTDENDLGYHEIFSSISWPVFFFILYLLSIGYLRYVTIHDTKVRNYRTENITTGIEKNIPWDNNN